jgi:hypothetical protein
MSIKNRRVNPAVFGEYQAAKNSLTPVFITESITFFTSSKFSMDT